MTSASNRGSTTSEQKAERDQELALARITHGTEGAVGITPEDRARLRAPFAGSAIRWLPIGNYSYGKQQFLPYINASLVFERLSEVDPSWTVETRPALLNKTDPGDPFGLKHGAPWRADLTLKGVTRPGTGQLTAGAKADDKHLKSGESDAIKRAALAFEIGAYLRAFDMVFLPKNVNGKECYSTKEKDKGGKKVEVLGYLTDEGKRQLRAHYERIIGTKVFVDRYGAAIEYGDDAVNDALVEDGGANLSDESAAVAAEAVEDDAPATNDELQVLLELTKYNGRDTPKDVVEATLKQYPFTRCLAQVLTSVRAALLVDDDDGEKLRALAVDAAQGSDEALERLRTGLEELAALVPAQAGDDEDGEQA